MSQDSKDPIPRSLVRRLLAKPTLKSVHDGLGIEFARDLIKGALMSLGGLALTILLSGLGNLTWSLQSFNLFGAVNEVDAPNQKLGSEAVYRVPLDTTVRLEGGAFLALNRGFRSQIEAILTSSSGQRENQYISPSNPLFKVFECDRIGVQLMEKPAEDATSVLVLYTKERAPSDECKGFFNRIFG